MKRAITTTLAPNYQADDVRLCLRLLLSPWRWQSGAAVTGFEGAFARWLPVANAVSFGTGRGALLAILKTLQLEAGDEVLLAAFTCVAVPAAVQWANGTPVYVDIDPRTYTIDAADLARKITPRSRAVIVQHTFGYPADLEAVAKLARARGLFVIEDCAHALGVRLDGRRLGLFGDAAIFSFGRDKPISSVFGGMAVTNDEFLGRKLRTQQQQLVPPSRGWVVRQLLQPILTVAAQRTLHFFGFGKLLLRLARLTRVLSLAVTPEERQGRRTALATYRLPDALAELAFHQFQKREAYGAHRRTIADRYEKMLAQVPNIVRPPVADARRENGYLLYTVRVRDPERLLAAAERLRVHLGEWYRTAIAPHDVNAAAVGYRTGTCPAAEQAARSVVNLPTHIGVTVADAQLIADIVRRVQTT